MANNKNINERSMLRVGQTLQMGKYRVDELLASGGFGNTYVVTNTRFEERWAMKEFFMKGVNERGDDQRSVSVSNRDNRPQFDAQREKFRKEARRLRRLSHPNIVHVEDLFDENGTTYYVMDYIGGGSLSEQLKKNGAFTEQQVLFLLPPLLDALEYVHNQQMWHLDLKPGNILIGSEGQPVLIDFGASKQMGLTGNNSTSTGMTYTPGYAPSEQIDRNFDRIGPWTDLYALGATIYNLLTRKTPPTVSEIQEGEEEAFEFPKDMSAKMRRLIVWLMIPNRRRRPQAVDEVRQFLNSDQEFSEEEDYTEEDTVIGEKNAPTPAIYEEPAPSIQEEPAPVFQKEAHQDIAYEPDEEQRYPYQKSPKQSNKSLWIIIGVLSAAIIVVCIFLFSSGKKDNKFSPSKDKITAEAAKVAEQTATATTVTDKSFTSSLGDYSYTGPVDGNGQPDGIGEAKFKNGKSYQGPFAHGKFHGKDATFRYANGDVFTGEFRDNLFYRGRYTVSEDGSYFEGSFSNGQPDKGTWYDKNNNKLE